MSSDRSVLITGASSGIGTACAKRLAAAGWHVYAGVRTAGTAPPQATEVLLGRVVTIGSIATPIRSKPQPLADRVSERCRLRAETLRALIRVAIERLPDRLRDRVITRALLGG